jgi:copper chaperone CopZ
MGCANTVEKALKNVSGVTDAKVDFAHAEVQLQLATSVRLNQLQEGLVGYAYQILEKGSAVASPPSFWADQKIWGRAGFNTLNCLIGCSVGDFGMIIFLQAFYPNTGMMTQMVLATIAGLCTSILLETILLRVREKFNWTLALQTAFSMSFISMVAMELAMNTSDFMMTGGKAAFGNPMYWIALAVSLVVGFLAPLPYNYYKLKKYNKACH